MPVVLFQQGSAENKIKPASASDVASAIAPASGSAAGSLSAADKLKLDALNPGTVLNWRGAWSSAGAYVLNDEVVSGGSAYVCILARSATGTTPDADATHWMALGIADGSVTNAKVAANAAIDGTKINGSTLSGVTPANNSVGTAQLANGAVTGSKLAADIAISTTGTATASGFIGDGSGLTNLTASQISGTFPNIDASALSNLTAANINPDTPLPACDGSALTNLNAANINPGTPLPACDGSALTNLNAANINPGTPLPACDGSALTNLNAANLSGGLPVIDGSGLTGLTAANINPSGTLPTLDGSALQFSSILALPGGQPGAPAEGQLYYDSAAHKLMVYTGATWETITSA